MSTPGKIRSKDECDKTGELIFRSTPPGPCHREHHGRGSRGAAAGGGEGGSVRRPAQPSALIRPRPRVRTSGIGKSRLDPCAVSVGSHGEPLWPPGIAGSITHRGGLWAAVVAHRSAYRALGIDVEINRPLPPRVRNRVVSQSAPLPPSDSIHWDTVIFSAMESVFKARHFLRGPTRGLIETKVLLDPQRLTFQGKIDPPDDNLPHIVDGVFVVEGGMILTAAIVPADPTAPTLGQG